MRKSKACGKLQKKEVTDDMAEKYIKKNVCRGLAISGLLGMVGSLGGCMAQLRYGPHEPDKPAALERLEKIEDLLNGPSGTYHDIKTIRTRSTRFDKTDDPITSPHGPIECFRHSENLPMPAVDFLTQEELGRIQAGLDSFKGMLKEYKEISEDPRARREIQNWREEESRYIHFKSKIDSIGIMEFLISYVTLATGFIFGAYLNGKEQEKNEAKR